MSAFADHLATVEKIQKAFTCSDGRDVTLEDLKNRSVSAQSFHLLAIEQDLKNRPWQAAATGNIKLISPRVNKIESRKRI
jgi:hypothetical protein